MKYFLKKLLGHETFRSMISWATNFFCKICKTLRPPSYIRNVRSFSWKLQAHTSCEFYICLVNFEYSLRKVVICNCFRDRHPSRIYPCFKHLFLIMLQIPELHSSPCYLSKLELSASSLITYQCE